MDPDELEDWLMPLCVPLCPLRRPEEANHYIDVDHLAELYDQFQALFPDPAQLPGPERLIVVDGDQGAGKTSLIFRCVHWLTSQAQQAQRPVTVVNLLDTSYPRTWKPGVMVLPLFQRILREAGLTNLTQAESESMSKTAENDLPLAFADLKRRHVGTLVVLLAPGPTADEIQDLAVALAPGMLLIAELADPAIGDAYMRQLNPLRQKGVPLIHRLSVGKLQPGDGQRVVDGIELLRTSGMPKIPAEVVSNAFQPEETGLHGISYYKRLALGSSKLAQQRHPSETQVDMKDVMRYIEFILTGQRMQGGQ